MTGYSCKLDITLGGITPREEGWLRKELEPRPLRSAPGTMKGIAIGSLHRVEADRGFRRKCGTQCCAWPPFWWSLVTSSTVAARKGRQNKVLRVQCDRSCAILPLCRLIQRFLKDFRPKECFGFGWSHNIVELAGDAPGGGAAFITPRRIAYINTAGWLRVRKEAFAKQTDRTDKRKAGVS
ncbi:MAG: hypothetical protein HYT87_13080 [Nitrospirae bacterium]|nr:hypothetical protein [Nitrospirota bacterium]